MCACCGYGRIQIYDNLTIFLFLNILITSSMVGSIQFDSIERTISIHIDSIPSDEHIMHSLKYFNFKIELAPFTASFSC